MGANGVPDCRQSNLDAGFDLLFAVLSVAGAAAALDDNNRPDVTADDRQGNEIAAVGLGGLAVLTTYSMFVGFSRSSACRDVVRASGYEPYGANDWLLPPVILITAGAAAAAVNNRTNAPATTPTSTAPAYDEDLCAPGATPTATCNDGVTSCSLNRSGTCSHHRGVAQWL